MSKIWILGNNIDTDTMAPGYVMALPPEELATHCLEAIRPDFAAFVKAGDVIIAGDNFGCGSSRFAAANALKYLGIKAIIANSYARIFYRNAFNVGLPLLTSLHATDLLQMKESQTVILNLEEFCLITEDNQRIELGGYPEHLKKLIDSDGIVNFIQQNYNNYKGKTND